MIDTQKNLNTVVSYSKMGGFVIGMTCQRALRWLNSLKNDDIH